MDLAWRYPVIVQVIQQNGHDVFLGYVPDCEIKIFEAVIPGSVSQEAMFHLKLRRLISERLTVDRTEKRESPPILPATSLVYSPFSTAEDIGSCKPSEMVSTTIAAQMLGSHPDTIRNLFDSGVLKGVLTEGKQRLVSLASIHDELKRRRDRAEIRKLEQKLKKRNFARKQRRVRKEKEAALERYKRNLEELIG